MRACLPATACFLTPPFVVSPSYPYYCGLTRNDIDFTIALSLDLVFFKDSVNLFVRKPASRAAIARAGALWQR